MADKPPQCRPHTDLRHRSQIPLPAIEAVERHMTELLGPSVLAPRSLERRDPRQPQRLLRMRQRLLTLPVMVARMGRLVWRRMPAVAEVQQVLAREGLWWAPPLRVSPRAIPKRLAALPAAALGPLFIAICTRLQAQAPTVLPQPSGAPVRAPFSPVAMGDGATLEARRHKTPAWREREGWGLAGKSVGLVEAFSPYPRWPLYTEDAAATDQRVAAERLAAVPAGALGVFALGFCSLLWCDDCTAATRAVRATVSGQGRLLCQRGYHRR